MAKGSATISLLVVIIIVGAVLLVGGIFPKTPQNTETPQEVIPDTSALTPKEIKSLQLKTFPFKQCASIATVDFLIDNSGSMQYGSKMVELKKAMVVFGANFPDSGILGIQIYSDPATYPSLGYKELIPITEFKSIKDRYVSAVNAMVPRGATHSKDAMGFAKQKLDETRLRYPNRKFNLVFISDGIPETQETEQSLCPGGVPNSDLCSVSTSQAGGTDCRCFATVQDPTGAAQEIKNSGVRIFTIYYVDVTDSKFTNRLETLMQNVASSPSDSFKAPVESQVANILSQISERLCN